MTRLCRITSLQIQLPPTVPGSAASNKRAAERLQLQEDLAEAEKRRTELRGLLAMYPDE